MIAIKTPKLKKPVTEVVISDNAQAIIEVKEILSANGNKIHRNELLAISKKYPTVKFAFDTSKIVEKVAVGERGTADFMLLKKSFMLHIFTVLPLENENDFWL